MTSGKKALVGLHDRFVANAFMRQLRGKGFTIDQALDLHAMQEYCGHTRYDILIMDLNLGCEGDLDITPARTIYNLLQQQGIEGLEQKFRGVSGSDEVIKLAQKEGIPAYSKTNFYHHLRELLEK